MRKPHLPVEDESILSLGSPPGKIALLMRSILRCCAAAEPTEQSAENPSPRSKGRGLLCALVYLSVTISLRDAARPAIPWILLGTMILVALPSAALTKLS